MKKIITAVMIAGFLGIVNPASAFLVDIGNGVIYDTTNDQYWQKSTNMPFYAGVPIGSHLLNTLSIIDVFNTHNDICRYSYGIGGSSCIWNEYYWLYGKWRMATADDLKKLWKYGPYEIRKKFSGGQSGDKILFGRYNNGTLDETDGVAGLVQVDDVTLRLSDLDEFQIDPNIDEEWLGIWLIADTYTHDDSNTHVVSQVDFDRDGNIDRNDYRIFRKDYTKKRWYRDEDGDGFSNGKSVYARTQPQFYYPESQLTAIFGDYDDKNDLINPAAVEICGDNRDNNCNDMIDENCE